MSVSRVDINISVDIYKIVMHVSVITWTLYYISEL